MKKLVIGLTFVFSLGIVGVASAAPYLDVYDFSTDGTWLDQTYSELSDLNSDGYFGIYSHTVDFNPNAESVQSAELTLTYAYVSDQMVGNPKSLQEIFLFYDDSAQQIGSLTGYADDSWHSQTFDLSSFIAGITGANWTIGFQFQETSNGNDKFYLDESRLFGNYTPVAIGEPEPQLELVPVPEPSTFLLLGGGLAGLAFVARRRKKE